MRSDPLLRRPWTVVIIPVLDEEEGLSLVLGEIPMDVVDEIVVVDNGCTDQSMRIAREHGAHVVSEPRRGYGAAMMAGVEAAPKAEILVFLDGDHSDDSAELPALLDILVQDEADMVVGSRMISRDSRRAMLFSARAGTRLAVFLLRILFGMRCSDLGPFRVINRKAFDSLQMRDRDFGWTIEMQIRARRRGLRVCEVPVRYRKRVGKSKISGTLSGTVRAGYKILKTISAYRIRPPRFEA